MIVSPPANAAPSQPEKSRILQRKHRLEIERSPWLAVWRQQADYILPRRFRDNVTNRNRPETNDKLINNTPAQAARTLASGLMSGLTSPARPWFRLGIAGRGYAKSSNSPSGQWASVVEGILREVLIRSNIYNVLAHAFGDLGTFCTAAMLIEEDAKEIVRGYTIPLGSFSLTTSSRGQVDGIIRDVPMTVAQVVQEFGLENCSGRVQELHRRNEYDTVVEVAQAIEPNPGFVPGHPAADRMAWRSRWFETREDISDGRFLREGGFDGFPVMAPRWNVTGTDTYGHGPGFDALGDAKALQLLERRKAMVIDRITNPPMVAPSSLRAGRPSLLPGDVTYLDKISGGQGFEPAVIINPGAITAIDGIIRSHEDRINRAFYADLWLALTMDDRNQRATAREVAERHEEKLLTLGPVLERLHDELLDKLIERVFNICLRRGLLPPPPAELQGQTIRVEYISIMAQAQRLLGVSAVERMASFVGNLAAATPQVLDKFNSDAAVDQYGDMLGIDPGLIRTDDEVAALRAQRAAAAEQRNQQEMAARTGLDMAKSAELLSKTDVNGTPALNRLISTQGGGAPIPVAP